jgi:hypothetical protein
MIELEVYAVGLREGDNIMRLDHELGTLPGLRYQADPNHDIVYFEMDEPVVSMKQLTDAFRRIELAPRFVGEIPS